MTKEIQFGDTVYELTPSYKAGVRACRARIPCTTGNPYRFGSQSYWDWDTGHCNEASILDGECEGSELKNHSSIKD